MFRGEFAVVVVVDFSFFFLTFIAGIGDHMVCFLTQSLQHFFFALSFLNT